MFSNSAGLPTSLHSTMRPRGASWAIISRGIQEDGSMWLEDHFGSGSMLQRNERVKLAASFWNNIGAGMVIGGMAAAFFLDKPQGTWTKMGIAIVGLVLGWLCYSIASNILTYMHTALLALQKLRQGAELVCNGAQRSSVSR